MSLGRESFYETFCWFATRYQAISYARINVFMSPTHQLDRIFRWGDQCVMVITPTVGCRQARSDNFVLHTTFPASW
jgi:hypothetical protein